MHGRERTGTGQEDMLKTAHCIGGLHSLRVPRDEAVAARRRLEDPKPNLTQTAVHVASAHRHPVNAVTSLTRISIHMTWPSA